MLDLHVTQNLINNVMQGCCVRKNKEQFKHAFKITGQEETHVRLPGASKFCSWASENGSLVARWASETSLSSLVSDNSS